jgi:hypothetical protein
MPTEGGELPLEAEARRRIAAWPDRVLLYTFLWCCAHDKHRSAEWMNDEIKKRERDDANRGR